MLRTTWCCSTSISYQRLGNGRVHGRWQAFRDQTIHIEEMERGCDVELGCRMWRVCHMPSTSHGCLPEMSNREQTRRMCRRLGRVQSFVPQLLHVLVGETEQPMPSVSTGVGSPTNRKIAFTSSASLKLMIVYAVLPRKCVAHLNLPVQCNFAPTCTEWEAAYLIRINFPFPPAVKLRLSPDDLQIQKSFFFQIERILSRMAFRLWSMVVYKVCRIWQSENRFNLTLGLCALRDLVVLFTKENGTCNLLKPRVWEMSFLKTWDLQ